MSEEKRIDRLEGLYIENKATIGNHERMIAEMKATGEKILSEVSALRVDFHKQGERLAWRMIAASAVGGAVAGLIAIYFGK